MARLQKLQRQMLVSMQVPFQLAAASDYVEATDVVSFLLHQPTTNDGDTVFKTM